MIRGNLLALLMACPAAAADYCGRAPGDAPVTQALGGAWNAVLRGGVAVVNGKPHALPVVDTAQKAVFTPAMTGLTLAEDAIFPALAFAPAQVVPDFALPGESALPAAELLQPETEATGMTCDPATLPQFHGEVTLDGGVSATFHLFALTPDQMVMVIRAEGKGQVVRAVFDLKRGLAD
jgi:hypothetical protein